MPAQGQLFDLVAPGSRGLWTEADQRILSPIYCTKATNLRLSNSGALTLRNGYDDQTTTELSADVKSLHEYRKANGDVEMILAWDGGISNNIDSPAANDISGSVSDGDGAWFFQNFNDKCIGLQDGETPIVYSGSTFATIVAASGTAPSGGVGCAAYGRLWVVNTDGQTIQYSGLLDETDWGGTGAGQIAMNNIWTDGQDTVQAIRGFNGALVVWGKRHVVFFADAQGTEIGVNPNNLFVQDIIAGTGCASQNSVQLIGEADILFASSRGIQSLGRLIQERSNPIETLTAKVEAEIVDHIQSVTATDNIRSVILQSKGCTYQLPDEQHDLGTRDSPLVPGRRGQPGAACPCVQVGLGPVQLGSPRQR